MNQREFESELARVVRRLQLLRQVQSGDVTLKRIRVQRTKKRWTVTARTMVYYRNVAPRGWKP